MAQFINPYNFVPISDNPSMKNMEKGNLTGYIEYEVVTKSSLFIPNTTSEKAFEYIPTMTEDGKKDDPNNEHKAMDFFSYNNLEPGKFYNKEFFEPVIPGSEMRGTVRSIYEALTNSCLSKVNENTVIGKRTVERFLPGVIKRQGNQYVLYDVHEDTIYRNRKNFAEKKYADKSLPADGSKVFVNLGPKQRGKKDVIDFNGSTEGYIIKGEAGPTMPDKSKEKHCAHVFIPEVTSKIKLNNEEVDRLSLVIKQYQKENENAYKEYKRTYDEVCRGEKDGLAVYYSMVGKNIMLSPACITREIYRQNVTAAYGGYGSCKPKTKEDFLCPACGLFGLISNEGFSKGSQIRFTDLTLNESNQYCGDYSKVYDEELYVMPELAEPKISNPEMYLRKPIDPDGEVWFWTYDYYTVKKKDGTVIVKEYNPSISGRKFYWHGKKIIGYKHKTNRNKTVRTVKEGITFTGRVYFDHITELQLTQLQYILNYSKDGTHGIKIGSGKPVGLGSVAIKIKNDGIICREFIADTQEYRIKTRKYDSMSWLNLGFDEKVKNAFMAITEFLGEADASIVHYPGVNKEGDEGFKWFVTNKRNHKLNSWNIGENRLAPDNIEDRSPRARIQTELQQYLSLPDVNKYLSDGREQKVNSEFCKAEVIDFIDGKPIMIAKLNNGKRVRIHIKNVANGLCNRNQSLQDVFSIGSIISIKHLGINDAGFDEWQCIGKEK